MRLTYWMYEGTAHHGVGRIANSLKNVHAVYHAPLGDDYTLPIHTMLERTPDFVHATTSLVTGTRPCARHQPSAADAQTS
jgi:light-independent protochlorophyllide reductase subunit B